MNPEKKHLRRRSKVQAACVVATLVNRWIDDGCQEIDISPMIKMPEGPVDAAAIKAEVEAIRGRVIDKALVLLPLPNV